MVRFHLYYQVVLSVNPSDFPNNDDVIQVGKGTIQFVSFHNIIHDFLKDWYSIFNAKQLAAVLVQFPISFTRCHRFIFF